jgi:hypothetical protein
MTKNRRVASPKAIGQKRDGIFHFALSGGMFAERGLPHWGWKLDCSTHNRSEDLLTGKTSEVGTMLGGRPSWFL